MKYKTDAENARIENERNRKIREELEYKNKIEAIHQEFVRSKKENRDKFYAYQSAGNAIFKAINGIVNNCGQVKDQITHLKKTKHYEQIILRYIIDGIEWDGIIRGNDEVGECIMLEGERFWCTFGRHLELIPPDEFRDFDKTFKEGLLLIKSLQEKFGDCSNCKFIVEKLKFDADLFYTGEDEFSFSGEKIDLSVCDYNILKSNSSL